MLRITKQTDYAIVLMTHFALAARNSVHSARDLARLVSLPLPTVSKILKALARADLLASWRGVKGGYSLAHDPDEISVASIIEAFEGPIAITECCDTPSCTCDIESSCPVRVPWNRLNDAVRAALVDIPLSDMTISFFPPAGAK